jgi:hypothetical protein
VPVHMGTLQCVMSPTSCAKFVCKWEGHGNLGIGNRNVPYLTRCSQSHIDKSTLRSEMIRSIKLNHHKTDTFYRSSICSAGQICIVTRQRSFISQERASGRGNNGDPRRWPCHTPGKGVLDMSLIIMQRMKPCSVRFCGPLRGSSETKHGELPDKEITRRLISIWTQSVLQVVVWILRSRCFGPDDHQSITCRIRLDAGAGRCIFPFLQIRSGMRSFRARRSRNSAR